MANRQINFKSFLQAVTLALMLAVLPLASAQAKKPRHHAPPAAAAEPAPSQIPVLPPLVATYDVYVGGFHIVTSQVWFEEQGNAYHALVKAQTRGIWSKLFPWHTVLDAHGRINGEQLEPQEFFTRDEWGHKPKITRLHYDGKGGVTAEFDPPNDDKNREIVTPEQRLHSLDPVTALLQMLAHVMVDNSCGIPVPVFDGKRRFDITGKDAGYDQIDGEGYGVYSGKARLCTADFKMISGEWKDREHARFWQKTETEAGRDPFQIWLAPPAQGLPEMPVRLESGSIAGLVVVHLSSWCYASEGEIKAEAID
ncbi:MAG: DUF3108 domain-containing protein [Alphaproteobacteria bacterium]|nr:DUF3108 domain-containing protein [Alphaproteobacteria bacterium]